MAKSSTYWDKRAIKRMTDAEKTSEVYIQRIKNIYQQAYKNIDGEITRVYKNYAKETGIDVQKLKELLTRSETKKTWEQMKRQGLDKYIQNNYKSRISRLEQIQAQIYAKAKQIYPKEELENTMCYKGVINNSYYKTFYDTQMGTGYDFSFNKIDNNLLNTVLNEKWSGKNYSQRIWTNTDILADSLSQIVGGALISGQSIEKTSKQIRDRFNVGKYYAERLVRTETNHFNNEADAMAYEEMGVKEYVFVAVLDNRTSEMCQSHDNKKYKYKDREVGINYPPLHPNCRSTTRGYLSEEAEKNLQRRARNPITGKTELIDNISYKDWINKQNNDTSKDLKNNENSNTIKDIQNTLLNIYGDRRSHYQLNLMPKEDFDENDINNIFNVNVKGIDNTIISDIATNLKRLGNNYYSTLTNIELADNNYIKYKPNVNAYVTTQSKVLQSTLSLNPKKLNKYREHIELIKGASENGYLPKINPENYKYYVSTHEFAHTIFNNTMLGTNYINMDKNIYSDFDKELTVLFENYKKKIDTLKIQKKKLNTKLVIDTDNFTKEDSDLLKNINQEYKNTFVSDYATRDNLKDEFMAECFAEARLSDNPSSTAIEVDKLINKYFKK